MPTNGATYHLQWCKEFSDLQETQQQTAKDNATDDKWPTSWWLVHSFYAVDEIDKTLDVDATDDLRWTLVYADGFCVTEISR